MPVLRKKDKNGKYYQFGDGGKRYYYTDAASRERAKKKALKQGAAMHLSKQKGGSFLDSLINSNTLPEMHYVSPFSGKRFNFAGPFTKLNKRVDKNMKPLPNSIPVNRVDQSAYHHDLGYNEHKDHNTRKILDNIMIDDLDMIRNDKNADWKERGDALLVGLAMKTKRLLGLGKKRKPKNKKKLK